MRVVAFKNDKFGIRRGSWLWGYEFLNRDADSWWTLPKLVQKYCHFDTIEEALAAMPETVKRDNGKTLKGDLYVRED